MPFFSVIIPTYNRAALLREALDSVLGQTFSNYEVIVADDGSTDDTPAVVSSYGNKIHFLRQANQGPGAARNLGAQQATGEYLAFLDSDDVWFPWTLKIISDLIRKYRSPAILSGRLFEFSHVTELAALREEALQAENFPDFLSTNTRSYFVGAGMAILRREEFLRTGGFTQRRVNCEDHDLILRMGAEPGFVQVLQPVTLAWRRHADEETRNYRCSYEGIRYLMEQERGGHYPGGRLRSHERRDIISKYVRSTALDCLRHGLRREAWKLYREAFHWNLKLGRWKYLAGFPIKAMLT